MNNHTNSSLAASSEAPHNSVAQKWLSLWNNPDDEHALDQLGTEIDYLLCRLLPRGRILGPLLDWEADIRQEAGLLLYQRYLAGNKDLISASRLQDHEEITGQIRRAVWVALKVTIWRYRKKFRRVIQLFESSANIDEFKDIAWPHPAEYRRIGELPLDVQLHLVRSVLRRAVREKRLSVENAAIASTLLEGNISQAQLAKSLGVSRQAINQRLLPVRQYLQSAIHDEEFPLS